MAEHLVESALLTHGLMSITEEALLDAWPNDCHRIVWMEDGQVIIDGMERFCAFRKAAGFYGRVNYQNFEQYVSEKKSGALTASGTMKVCRNMGVPLAVTCGMGGLMKDQDAAKCHDIEALTDSKVSLVAASPKDMFDLEKTVVSMKKAGITVLGYESDICNGYLFAGQEVKLSGNFDGREPGEKVLYLKGIPKEDRIADIGILNKAYSYGKEQEKAGRHFHPAVNEAIDKMTCGKSSKIQLNALIANVRWAETL